MLEAVGHMPAYEQAYGIVRPGGVISRVGVPQYEEAPIGFGSLFGKNASLAGGPAPGARLHGRGIPQCSSGEINPGGCSTAPSRWTTSPQATPRWTPAKPSR